MAEEDDSDPIEISRACCAVHKNNCYIFNFGVSSTFCDINIYNFERSRWHIAETLVSGGTDYVGQGTCCLVIKDRYMYLVAGFVMKDLKQMFMNSTSTITNGET